MIIFKDFKKFTELINGLSNDNSYVKLYGFKKDTYTGHIPLKNNSRPPNNSMDVNLYAVTGGQLLLFSERIKFDNEITIDLINSFFENYNVIDSKVRIDNNGNLVIE